MIEQRITSIIEVRSQELAHVIGVKAEVIFATTSCFPCLGASIVAHLPIVSTRIAVKQGGRNYSNALPPSQLNEGTANQRNIGARRQKIVVIADQNVRTPKQRVAAEKITPSSHPEITGGAKEVNMSVAVEEIAYCATRRAVEQHKQARVVVKLSKDRLQRDAGRLELILQEQGKYAYPIITAEKYHPYSILLASLVHTALFSVVTRPKKGNKSGHVVIHATLADVITETHRVKPFHLVDLLYHHSIHSFLCSPPFSIRVAP
jgi:hypothetical protein